MAFLLIGIEKQTLPARQFFELYFDFWLSYFFKFGQSAFSLFTYKQPNGLGL